MARKYRLYQVDSFTGEKFTGNPAGVIPNADGLTAAEMQKIARELNNSETAFIFSANNEAYDVHLRFFTPQKEVPSCGHATIAAHYVRAIEKKLDTVRVMQRIGAGILPVDIIREKNDYRIIMTQGPIELGALIGGADRKFLLNALHITEEDLLENCPIQVVSTGHAKVLIGLRQSATLNQLKPNFQFSFRIERNHCL